MLINSLSLNNFGLYSGEHVIDLGNTNKEKPIILIGGMNGRGKTTILEAILLALYGRRSFAFLESKLSYPAYLRKYVNKMDGSLKSWIEITFVLTLDDQSENITLKRVWDIDVKSRIDQLFVYKNGQYDKYLSDNWSTYFENILPSGVSRFFFFDGEKIADIAEEHTDTQLKDSIKTLLGIDTIDRLANDLKKIVLKKNYKYHLESSDSGITELNNKKNALTVKAEEIKQRISSQFSKQSQLRIKLEERESQFIKLGGSFVNLQSEMMAKKSFSKSRIKEMQEELIRFASGELPLMLVSPLLEDIQLDSKTEENYKIKKLTSETINPLLIELRRELKGIAQAAAIIDKYEMDFHKYTLDKEELIFNLSSTAQVQVDLLNSTLLKENSKRIRAIVAERDRIQRSLDEVESYLTIDIDEELSNNILQVIKDYTTQIAEFDGKIQLLNNELTPISKEIFLIERELNRLIENALKNFEEKDDSARIVKYANLSMDLVEKYKLALQRQKTTDLAKVMTDCFTNIIDKNTLISRIDIDPDTLDFTYYDENDDQIFKSQLSAGEKQILVIAMLWALAICSREKLPIIIDTPLGRLDSSHRTNFLVRYLPNVSEQAIVLSTDEEINGKYLELIEPYVNKKYLLKYKPETRSSEIINGYFLNGDR